VTPWTRLDTRGFLGLDEEARASLSFFGFLHGNALLPMPPCGSCFWKGIYWVNVAIGCC
jgi:hypothetical protein